MIAELYPLMWPRIYAYIRTKMLALDKIERFVPEGKILDVGCGYGITSIYFALKNKKREVIGSELQKKRVKTANKASRNILNVFFEANNLIESDEKFDAIIAIDLLHHISNTEKKKFIADAKKRLNKNGVLIIKEIDKKPILKYWWNYIHDMVMMGGKLNFYSSKQIKKLVEKNGFEIKEFKRLRSFFYPHVLFVCEV